MKQFPPLNLPPVALEVQNDKVYDSFRKKWILLTPEEWVRQNFLQFLVQYENFPKGLISVEKQIQLNGLKKRYDAVVFNTKLEAKILIEFKAYNVEITQETVNQAVRYNQLFKVNYLILSNGINHFIININYLKKSFSYVKSIKNVKLL